MVTEVSWRVWGGVITIFPIWRTARFGSPALYHFGLPAGLPFYRVRHFSLPSSFEIAINHAKVRGWVGGHSALAQLPVYRFTML